MSQSDAEKWDAIYSAGKHLRNEPVKVLQDYAHLLPTTGTALDVACGSGSNALFLARHGLKASAWDISEQAINLLNEKASQMHINIETRVCDIVKKPPDENSFDIIVVSYFLDRVLFPALVKALKNNGLLFYQTFSIERTNNTGPSNDNYRLARNELLELCHDLKIILYHEEGLVGNTQKGLRNEVMLIGQRL